jgi:predicted nucleic acid-binding protein
LIVADAAAVADAMTREGSAGERARAALAQDERWLVPEHWPAEVFSAIRGLYLGGKLTETAAEQAIRRLARTSVEQASVRPLLVRMWALRHNFGAYDAPYVALAAQHDLTLVTGDERLARAAVAHCRVQLV